MKFYYIILFFITCCSIKAQNPFGIKEVKGSNISLYRIAEKKCPGSISHGDCFRRIFIISDSIPLRKNVKKSRAEIYYQFQDGDMLILAGDYEKFWLLGYFYENEEYPGVYDKIDSHKLYNFTKANQIILKDKRNFFLGKYELKNIDYFIVNVDVSYLNSKVLEGNILIDLPSNVRVPVIIPFDNVTN